MSVFKVNIVACNPQREDRTTPPIEVLVDTGAELTWLPAEMLARIGIQARRKRTFQTATKQLIEREVGYAILRAEGYETTDEVVFAQPSDLNLLGVRTIEGFGVMVDNIAHRFVATTTLVASALAGSSRRIGSPRLAHPEQAGDFRKQVAEVPDASSPGAPSQPPAGPPWFMHPATGPAPSKATSPSPAAATSMRTANDSR
jgi:predicted aspartyl protease